MKLLINEDPIPLLPSLVHLVGINGALFLQQLHFRSLISKNVRDGHRWVYKTYDDWLEEFSFWSRMTIKRITYDLEKQGYLISTSEYNKMKIDKTKWYRIDYTKLPAGTMQDGTPNGKECDAAMFQPDTTDVSQRDAVTYQPEMSQCTNLVRTIPKESKEIKNKDMVEKHLDDAHFIINYLNEKTGKRFKAMSAATRKFINGRLKEGYTQEDFVRVIDLKVSQWINNTEYQAYLRPSTLFNATNFENYLNEKASPVQPVIENFYRAPVLDFSGGEDISQM